MIDTKELRLGNWINVPICGINAKIDVIGAKKVCIDVHEVDLESGDSSFEANDVDPIPLTEKWLLDFGFEDNSYGRFHIKLNEFCYFFVGFKDSSYTQLREFVDVADYDIESPCKYVHQLQNLHFALTGKELEINHGN